MARVLNLEGMRQQICENLSRSFQSGHVNFLIGSGASFPAIPIAGQIEEEIADFFKDGQDAKAHDKMYELLSHLQASTNRLIADKQDENDKQSIAQYAGFLSGVERILSERRTTLLPKQVTVFTTNYDLLIEKASIVNPTLRLNDGFSRGPTLDYRMEYSSRNFFNTVYNTGNLYNYRVEIPCLNLVKLHGSLSWRKDGEEIVFQVKTKELLSAERTHANIIDFIEGYAVVLPQVTKFRTTLIDQTYYELLRIYANELDRENAILVSFGFSFRDEHILRITKRALKNPTLRLIYVAYDKAASDELEKKFFGYNNVEIVAPVEGASTDFMKFNEILCSFLPVKRGGA